MERDRRIKREEPDETIRRQILAKLCKRLNGLNSVRIKLSLATQFRTKPDVVVTTIQQTVLFESQNQRAAQWLRARCHLAGETVSGNTEFRVHPSRCKEIIQELRAAGFNVEESHSVINQ